MKLIYKGKFTEGYYNDMEAGFPVFIDGKSLSNLVKEMLQDKNLPTNFCDNDKSEYSFNNDDILSNNYLVGTSVTLMLMITSH